MEISILVKVYEYLGFVKIVVKSWSWSTFSENLDLSQYRRQNRFGLKFSQILVLVKFPKNVYLGQKLCQYVDLVKNFQLKFGQICRKSWFWSKWSKMLDFGQNLKKISIWVKIYKNLEFGQNFQIFFRFW